MFPAALAVVSALTSPVGATADDGPVGDPIATTQELTADGRFVVVLDEDPLVTQFGADGVDSSAADAKAVEMKADQEEVATEAGVSSNEVTYSYTYALNGFSVELNEAQLTKMQTTDGVKMIIPDTIRQAQTDSTGEFLGLPSGPWSNGLLGDGVVVGVIDNGIWPEHPSFADDGSYPDPGLVLDESVYPACDFGNTAHNPNDAPFTCNNKLVGARQILPTYRAVVGAIPEEFDSARDDAGHGSHTASTAAGNAGVEATVLGKDVGQISGVAPRAHIIAYKGLGDLGGFGSDLAAAIDQAVADGVDVINYSIGSSTAAIGPDDLAFLYAADAGVHVATSGGNSGPDPATIGSPAAVPWLTTVAASTQERFFLGVIQLGNGDRYFGSSLTDTLATTELVDAEFAGIGGSNGELCIPGSLDPAIVGGKVVLCQRGTVGRADKSSAVAEAGGAGMILYNTTDVEDLFTDSHFVPSVHVDATPGLAIKEYIASAATPTASIPTTASKQRVPNAPMMTSFSSRGPNPLNADIIKPDITAPGFQIVAAYSPLGIGGVPGENFASIAGTSMSSPHVAGLMALMDQQHPDWSPAAVKSALMTTAYQGVLDNDRVSPADPFDMGAGHVDIGSPTETGSAFNPGLVYDAGLLDYFGYLCDTLPDLFADPAATCGDLADSGVAIEAYDLNYPSIGVSELAGTQVVTRTVTNVDSTAAIYNVRVEAPAGYEVEVTPARLKLEAGESATYQARITNIDAPVGEWRHGSLTWVGAITKVRSPISVQGVSYAAPSVVDGSGEAGSASIPVRFGYTGEYTAGGHGLEAATVFSDNVLQDPDQVFDPSDLGAGATLHEVEASGAALLRIAMPPEATEAEADLDIFVIGPAGDIVATSTAGGTDELIDLVLPDDGTYSIYVHGWSSPGGDSDYDLYTWLISATPGGNMSIDSAPASATNGSTIPVEVSWTGATAGQWHLGAVSHSNGEGLMGLTLVQVDNR